jgi:hypothetical protein
MSEVKTSLKAVFSDAEQGELKAAEARIVAESELNQPTKGFQDTLVEKYGALDDTYDEKAQTEYAAHADKILTALRSRKNDTLFTQMTEAEEQVFGQGLAVVLHNTQGKDNIKAGLLDAVAMYRELNAPRQSNAEEASNEEQAPRVSPTKRALGRLATGLSGFKRSIADSYVGQSASSAFGFAGAKTGMAMGAVAGVAQKGFAAYRKPLDKMEAKKDDSKSKRFAKLMGRSAYRIAVAGGVAGLAYTTKNVAEAANITVNGHQGGASNAFNDTIAHSDIGRGEKNVPVRWSAEMGDLPIFPEDKLSTLESTDEGARRIAEIVAQNPGKNTLIGYSEGGIAIAKFLQDNPDYLAQGNEVVFVGSPYVPGQRMGDHAFLELVKPLLPDTAKTLEYQTPGGQNVTHIVREDDFVKLKDNPIGMLAALDPKGHYYSPADISGNTPHITVRNADGSTSMILTETHTKLADGSNAKSGISAALVDNNNMYVSRKADNFFEALDGEPLSGKINAGEVTRTGAAAAEEVLVSNGINPDHARVVKDVIGRVPAEPIQKLFDGVSDLPGALASNMPSGNGGTTGGGQPNLNQIVDTFTGGQNSAPAAPVQQFQQPIQQMTEQIAPVMKQFEAAAPQLAPQIQQGLGQLGIRLP